MNRQKMLRRIIPYIVLAFALISGLVAVRPAINFLNDRLHELQLSLVAAVEKATDLKVRYSHVSPSLLLRADINDFRLERRDGSVFFSADQVRISYNIFDFLSGDYLSAVKGVETVGSQLNFDIERDLSRFVDPDQEISNQAELDIPTQIKNGFDQIVSYLPPGIRFDFLDTSVTVMGSGTRLDFLVSQAGLQANPDSLDLEVVIRLNQVVSDSLDLLGGLSGDLRMEAQYFRQNRLLQTRVATKALTTRWGTLAPQNLSLIFDADEIRLNRIVDQEPVDLQIRWRIAENSIEASLQSDSWQIGSQFEASQTLTDWERTLLGGRYTSDLQGSYNLDSGSFAYQVHLRALASHSVDDDVQLTVDMQGDRSHLPKGKLDLTMPGASVSFHTNQASTVEKLAGDLQISLSDPWLPFDGSFDGPITLNLTKQGFYVNAPQFMAGIAGFPVIGDNLELAYRNNSLDFKVNATPAQSNLQASQISLSGQVSAKGLHLETGFAAVRLAENAGLIRPIVILAAGIDPGAIDLSMLPEDLELNGKLDLNTIAGLQLKLTDLQLTTSALDSGKVVRPIVSGDIVFDGKTLQFEKGIVETPQARYGLKGGLTFDANGAMSARIAVQEGSKTEWVFSGFHAADGQFNIQGPYGLFASGQEKLALGQGAQANLSFQNYPLGFLGEKAAVSGTVNAQIDALGDWQMRIQSLDLLSLAVNPGNRQRTGRLTIRETTIKKDGASINDIRYQDSQSSLLGNGTLTWEMERLPDFKWSINLHGVPSLQTPVVSPKMELLGINGQYSDGIVQTDLHWSDAPISRFIDESFKGFYDVDAKVSLRPATLPDSLEVSGTLKTPRALLNKDPILLVADFAFKQNKLSLDNLAVSLLEHRVGMIGLQADFKLGNLDLDATYQNTKNPGMVATKAHGSASWDPNSDTFEALLFNSLKAKLVVTGIPGMDKFNHDYEIKAEGVAGSLNFSETSEYSLRGRIRQDGLFQLNLQKPFPIAASVNGVLKGAQIEANITNIDLDIANFASFLDLGVFKMNAGVLKGSLRVVGDINDPDFYGSLRGNNIKARVSFIPDEISSSLGVLVFEEKTIRLLSLNALAGSAHAKVEGDFAIKRMNIEAINIQVDIPLDDKGVHVVGDFPMVNVDGLAKGHLGIGWSGNTLKLEGQIKAEDAGLQLSQFNRQDSKTPVAAGQPLATPNSTIAINSVDPMDYQVALGFTSGKAVEFFLPSRASPILRTNLDIDQSINILFNSQAGTWSLKGNLKSRGGEIIWLKRNFMMRQASLVFNENQDNFDPRISGQAETRMSIGEKTVKVSLVLDNNPLDKLNPRIVTDIPLSDGQLAALITGDIFQGNTGDTRGAANRIYDAASTAAVTASQLYVEGPALAILTEPIRMALGLDLLSLRTNLISNALVESGFKIVGYNSTDTEYNPLTKYFDNTTLQVGKFFGNDVYLEGILRLQKIPVRQPNAADWARDRGKALSEAIGLGLELDLGMEWEIPPFFNIGWSSSLNDLTSVDKWLKANAFTFSLHLP